jgi:hypothetical protein
VLHSLLRWLGRRAPTPIDFRSVPLPPREFDNGYERVVVNPDGTKLHLPSRAKWRVMTDPPQAPLQFERVHGEPGLTVTDSLRPDGSAADPAFPSLRGTPVLRRVYWRSFRRVAGRLLLGNRRPDREGPVRFAARWGRERLAAPHSQPAYRPTWDLCYASRFPTVTTIP